MSLQHDILCLPGFDPYALADTPEVGACTFDEGAAADAVGFIETCLHFVEGEWAGKSFKLEQWQRAVVANLFGWKRPDGSRRFRKGLLYIPRKNSKALSLDTKIPTPDGWRTMGEFVVGDTVFDETGKPCAITNATEVMHGHQCYRVSFSDGTSIVADAGHEWLTKTHKPENKTQVWTTEQIRATLRQSTRQDLNHSIHVASAIECPEKEYEIDPYVFGAWLGDGHSSCTRLTYGIVDKEIVKHLVLAGAAVSSYRKDPKSNAASILLGLPHGQAVCARGHDLAVNGTPKGDYIACRLCQRFTSYERRHGRKTRLLQKKTMQSLLRHMGVLNNKHIPQRYLRGSIRQRMALLQGLMDTDGTCSTRGQCSFTTTKTALRDGFLELVRSLGFKPTMSEGVAKLYGRPIGPVYDIQFWAFQDRPVFRLARKAARQKPVPVGVTRSMTRQITAVDPVPSVPVRCIQVDSPSHLYLAGEGMIPTHNSTLAAALTLTAAFTDNEAGAQIYCAAAEKEQAKFVWTAMRQMVETEPTLMEEAKIYKALQTIELPAIGAYIKPLSVDAKTKHGSNPHWVTLDEVHAQRDRDLNEALTSGMGARRQPMMFYLTTADHYGPSLCNEVYKFACAVRDNKGDPNMPGYDSTFLPIIYEAAKGEDWKDEKTWYKANPNLGVSVKLDFLRAECRKAQEVTTYENTFRRLHLNQQTEQSERWIPMDKWNACGLDKLDENRLRSLKCWGGLDLASTSDLAALVLAFPDGPLMHLKAWFWCPWEQAERREKRDRVPYLTWEKGGFLTRTPGDVIDYDYIRAQVNRLSNEYQIQDIGFDKFNAQQLVNQLSEDGIKMVEFGQNCVSMNDPCKQFAVLIERGNLRHGGNPVLNWMAGNVSIVFDSNQNFKPDKKRSGDKIDGIVASIMAVARAQNNKTSESVYANRGFLTVGGEDEEETAKAGLAPDFDGEIHTL